MSNTLKSLSIFGMLALVTGCCDKPCSEKKEMVMMEEVEAAPAPHHHVMHHHKHPHHGHKHGGMKKIEKKNMKKEEVKK